MRLAIALGVAFATSVAAIAVANRIAFTRKLLGTDPQ